MKVELPPIKDAIKYPLGFSWLTWFNSVFKAINDLLVSVAADSVILTALGVTVSSHTTKLAAIPTFPAHIIKIWEWSVTYDFGAIPAHTSSNYEFNTSGLYINGTRPCRCIVTAVPVQDGVIYYAIQENTEKLKIYAQNVTAVAKDPANTIFYITVFEYN